MNLLVVGGGGREHAIIRSLKKNPDVETIYALPGNGGIAADATCVAIGATDIEKAYDILRGSQSIRGDVPSTMFAYGTPDEVAAYCEKLVNMGMKGGFMLSSGCEIPLNAKVENVKAMIDVLRG